MVATINILACFNSTIDHTDVLLLEWLVSDLSTKKRVCQAERRLREFLLLEGGMNIRIYIYR
jgi:hypothetical protein